MVTLKPIKIHHTTSYELPLAVGISAGFPSPAADYMESAIDLNKELIKNPASTFFGRVKGLSMKEVGIADDDILIIDKSIIPRSGMIAVCFLDGEFTLKRVLIEKNCVTLQPANAGFSSIVVNEQNDFMIWGIVTYVIKKM